MESEKCPKCGSICTGWANNGWSIYACGYETAAKTMPNGMAMMSVVRECGATEDKPKAEKSV